MGKRRDQNLRIHALENASRPIKPPSDPELAALRHVQILPIIRSLNVQDPGLRSETVDAILKACKIKTMRKLLLRERIVSVLLLQVLAEPNLNPKNDVFIILLSLVEEEDRDFCVHLYRENILASLEETIRLISPTIESNKRFSKLTEYRQEQMLILCTAIVKLIHRLAIAHEEIFQAITKIEIVPTFLCWLLPLQPSPLQMHNSPILSSLICLMELTKDNQEICKLFADNKQWLDRLFNWNLGHWEGYVISCAILHNIFATLQWFDHNTPIAGFSDATLVPRLTEYINVEYQYGEETVVRLPHMAVFKTLASIARTVQRAIEHEKSYEEEFEGFPDDSLSDVEDLAEDQSETGEEIDVSKEKDDETMDADMELVTGTYDDPIYDPFKIPTLDFLIKIVIPGILNKLSFDPKSPPIRALAVFNNIASTMASLDIDTFPLRSASIWRSKAYTIWHLAVSPVLISMDPPSLDLALSVTSLAWALTCSLKGQPGPKDDESILTEAERVGGFYIDSTDVPSKLVNDENKKDLWEIGKPPFRTCDPYQALGVNCIGILGRLALSPASIELNRQIGRFFFHTILGDIPKTRPADVIAVLDQIFEIYGDEDYACDQVFWEEDFYGVLEKTVFPGVREMAKGIDRRKEMVLRGGVDEAAANLGRFLAFKRRERRRSNGRGKGKGNDMEG